MPVDTIPYLARCRYCGRDSIVNLNSKDGLFENKPCESCGQTAGWDGLQPAKGQSMSADISADETAKKQPKGTDGKKPSPLERLIGGGK